MSKFKQWLCGRFLPAWCREEMMEENTRLAAKVRAQSQEIDRLNAYIGGMQYALHRLPRITINAKEVRCHGSIDRSV